MKEIPKNYTPQDWEDSLYQQWEESGYFNPDTCIDKGVTRKNAKSFSIVLPPPNVTGRLHIGHAAMLAIEDVLIRHHRMLGEKTLWIPGTDHAAIATQEKVERILFEEKNKTRHDLGREAFLKRVEQFAQNSHDHIVNQIKHMGASLDWSREAYTLDDQRSFAVRTAFKKMYDDGIIYRGDRIVNWDPKMQTTVSDDEIEWVEENAPFYYFQYGPFVIGTARPETKFGDKYVVVHPDDSRYADFKHGQQIDVEWVNGIITATVIKDEAIDIEFGSGAMTITPWHDATDFDIAERHNLKKEQIIGYDGKILPVAGQGFEGLNIFEARRKIVEKLQEKGLLVDIEKEYTHSVATNSRGGGVIEPQIKKQWFIDVKKEFERDGKTTTLKMLMQQAVRSGNIRIIPKQFEKSYFHWVDNLRDWCISRQIWYGHRIPVWYRDEKIYCGIEPPKEKSWEQDPDTLDTWFSSGLWTFSTLGWPDATAADLNTYHPTSILETGYDILPFWVARMILMSTYLLDEVPFHNVYLHGLVRDEQGRKMSKSIGNVIDPLDVSQQYGTDAVRLSLLIGSTPGKDIKLSKEKIGSYRNFTNKLWNIGRYVLSQLSEEETAEKELSAADSWILSRNSTIIREVSNHIYSFNISLAGETLRDFTWNEFADWYLEIHKIEKNNYVLREVFETLLKLWHPFMPFVTEALWQEINDITQEKRNLLMVEQWPKEDEIEAPSTKQFEEIMEIIKQIRNIRSIYSIDPQKKVTLTIAGPNEEFIRQQFPILSKLGRLQSVSYSDDIKAQKNSAFIQTPSLKSIVHLDDILDIEEEKKRLQKEIDALENLAQSLKARLNNEEYISKAPEEIVEQSRQQLTKTQKKISQTHEHLSNLS